MFIQKLGRLWVPGSLRHLPGLPGDQPWGRGPGPELEARNESAGITFAAFMVRAQTNCSQFLSLTFPNCKRGLTMHKVAVRSLRKNPCDNER